MDNRNLSDTDEKPIKLADIVLISVGLLVVHVPWFLGLVWMMILLIRWAGL